MTQITSELGQVDITAPFRLEQIYDGRTTKSSHFDLVLSLNLSNLSCSRAITNRKLRQSIRFGTCITFRRFACMAKKRKNYDNFAVSTQLSRALTACCCCQEEKFMCGMYWSRLRFQSNHKTGCSFLASEAVISFSIWSLWSGILRRMTKFFLASYRTAQRVTCTR